MKRENSKRLPGAARRVAQSERLKRLGRRALLLLLYSPMAEAGSRRTRQRRPSAAPGEIKRIVVMRPDHLGDLLFATPALDRLREAFPEAHITGLVGPWGRAMWQHNPSLDSLVTVPFPGIASRMERPLDAYKLLGRIARKLSHKRYDLGIVLRFDHWWGAALLWAAGIERRWGYATPGTAPWLTGRVPYLPGRHEVEQNLYNVEGAILSLADPDRLKRLGALHAAREKGEPRLTPPRPAQPEQLPHEWLAAPRRAIIHPGTGAANKLWTIQGWAEVATRLTTEGWSVALTGSPGEKALADAILAQAGEAPLFNLAGQTASLSELTWLLDRAQMVLGVDSGPLHVASALDKPTLHLYGPSDESLWGPWGDPHLHRAFRAPGTRPTMHLDVLSTALEGGPDMRAISVDMVMSEVRGISA